MFGRLEGIYRQYLGTFENNLKCPNAYTPERNLKNTAVGVVAITNASFSPSNERQAVSTPFAASVQNPQAGKDV